MHKINEFLILQKKNRHWESDDDVNDDNEDSALCDDVAEQLVLKGGSEIKVCKRRPFYLDFEPFSITENLYSKPSILNPKVLDHTL